MNQAATETKTSIHAKKELAHKEMEAIASLLRDKEGRTLELLAEQVNKIGPNSLQGLSNLAMNSNDTELIDNWTYVSKLSLTLALKEWKQNPDLESGSFLLDRLENPGIIESEFTEILDKYAKRVEERLGPDYTDEQVIDALNTIIFVEENYQGNQVYYYDAKNNFIDTVMQNKAGNPITLSTIYILVGRRLGFEINGIGTPGHFIVKYGEKFIDPFFSGREITKDECHIRAQELGVFWRDEYLEPIDDISIIARSIRNLIAIYKRNKNFSKAADASELLGVL